MVQIERSGERIQEFIIAFDEAPEEGLNIILQSAVAVADECIFPGRVIAGAAPLQEHLKMRLVQDVDLGEESEDPLALVVLHLADVLAWVRSSVERVVGEDAQRLAIRVAIAAPLDVSSESSDAESVEARFRRAGWLALQLTESYAGGAISRASWAQRWAQLKQLEVPAKDWSPVIIVPEALAAVASHLLQPGQANGEFATLDVGGGTTDASFFWFNNGHVGGFDFPEAWYYAMHSDPQTGSKMLAEIPTETPPEADVQTLHQRLLAVRNLADPDDQPSVECYLSSIRDVHREAWKQAIQARNPPGEREALDLGHWCDEDGHAVWTLLWLGGGCRWTRVEQSLQAFRVYNEIKPPRRVTEMQVPSHIGVLKRDGSVADTSRAFIPRYMLVVAHGLAHRIPDLPEYSQEPRAPVRTPPVAWEPPPHTVHA
jgi:hypothetical protein